MVKAVRVRVISETERIARRDYKQQQKRILDLERFLENAQTTLLRERNERNDREIKHHEAIDEAKALVKQYDNKIKEFRALFLKTQAECNSYVEMLRSTPKQKCVCGNDARYVNERGELCCALCPLKEKIDSIQLRNVAPLLKAVRDLLAVIDKPSDLEEAREYLLALHDIVQSGPKRESPADTFIEAVAQQMEKDKTDEDEVIGLSTSAVNDTPWGHSRSSEARAHNMREEIHYYRCEYLGCPFTLPVNHVHTAHNWIYQSHSGWYCPRHGLTKA